MLSAPVVCNEDVTVRTYIVYVSLNVHRGLYYIFQYAWEFFTLTYLISTGFKQEENAVK